MIKRFTDKEYADKACEANREGKKLYILITQEGAEKYADLLIGLPNYYLCIRENYTYGVVNPDYEKEKEQKERERINKLSLTRREVFLALLEDKGIMPEQLRAQIKDPKALIEFDYASEYFRGNPLINSVGLLLGYTPTDLDYLFEHKSFPTHG